MKLLVLICVVLGSVSVHADNVVCALSNAKNKRQYVSTKVDLKNIQEFYYPDTSLDISRRRSYSYVLEVSKELGALIFTATFQENKVVQDEVGQESWKVKLTEMKNTPRGTPFITEPINGEPGENMVFNCYYNRN